jgi:hypothetical protein
MTVTLNEHILTQIYFHTFDFEALLATATATAINKQHPLREVVLRRLLQLPLRLSSENFKESNALIVHLVRNPARARLVRDISIVLGPSRRSLTEIVPMAEQVRHEILKKVERAEALAQLLPELWRHTENLQRLDWSYYPPPSGEILKELSERTTISHLSLDCSMGSEFFPDPSEQLTLDMRNK